MEVINAVIEVSKILDEIDKFDSNVSNKMSEFDNKLIDLYHYIENNPIDTKKAYRLCKELKSILNERRDLKNNVELLREFQKHKLKLNNGIANRQVLLSEMGKRAKSLNQPYKYRIYTDEELKEKIGV